MLNRHQALRRTLAAVALAAATVAVSIGANVAEAATVPLQTGSFSATSPSSATTVTLAAGEKRYVAATVTADYTMCVNSPCPVGDAANGDDHIGSFNELAAGVNMGGGAVFVYGVAGAPVPVGKGVIVTGPGTISFGINDYYSTSPAENLFSDNAGTVSWTVATNALVISNNGGQFDRRYVNLDYTCGTDSEVFFTSTEYSGRTGSNDDGETPTTISGTINTKTGVLNFSFVRGSYSSTFAGTGTWSNGTYTFVQGDGISDGGAYAANGTFINVPSCAVVPVVPADVCKDGGFKNYAPAGSTTAYRNQGLCVADFVRGKAQVKLT